MEKPFALAFTSLDGVVAAPAKEPPVVRVMRSVDGNQFAISVDLPTGGDDRRARKVSGHLELRYARWHPENPAAIAGLACGFTLYLSPFEPIDWDALVAELEENVDVNRHFAARLIEDVKALLRRWASEDIHSDPREAWVLSLQDYYYLEWALIQAISRLVFCELLPADRIRRALQDRATRLRLGADHVVAIHECCPALTL